MNKETFTNEEWEQLYNGLNKNYISLIKWLYDNYKDILREYEKTRGKLRVEFLNNQQDAGRLNSEMKDKPLKEDVNYSIPADTQSQDSSRPKLDTGNEGSSIPSNTHPDTFSTDSELYSQGKKNNSDGSNENYLEAQNRTGEGDKDEHMPVSRDNHPDTLSIESEISKEELDEEATEDKKNEPQESKE